MLGSLGYDFNITGIGIAGDVELCMVTERNSVRQEQLTELPSSLRSFVNTTPLPGAQNVVNSRFWNVKVLKRAYFSTIGLQGGEREGLTVLYAITDTTWYDVLISNVSELFCARGF